MPTQVSVARQCLTDEAARALDDAVNVARRRSHAQTTSLHAVSALLALPSSPLRDACSRARSSAYMPRLQFRALDLCVGVSLDRLPSSKAIDEPPISNSLMAAIKRSQANQRRHPENFHLQQIHCNNQQTASVLKVELKHILLSILDDPIVSRVFGEAGFRSCDIKFAIISPPLAQSGKFSRTRCPPIFLCNLTGSTPVPPSFSFDENCRRIGDVLLKRTGRAKNPLLVGVCANDAMFSFVQYVNRDKGVMLPNDIVGISAVSIGEEVVEFFSEEESGKEKLEMVFEDLRHKLARCSGPGIVLSFGELKVLVGEHVSNEALSYLVTKLKALLEGFREKLWLIGAAESYELYSKFLERFPSLETDWDLQPLPITSSSCSVDCFAPKSSLMGSFVPFGGFFSTPSDFRSPLSSISQPITRCHLCNAKYEQELAGGLKIGSTISVVDQRSENLPAWLTTELDMKKGVDVDKIKDDGTTWNTKILAMQKKWNDICQRLHHAQPFSQFALSEARCQVSISDGVRCLTDRRESGTSSSSSRDSSLNDSPSVSRGLGVNMGAQKVILAKPNIPSSLVSQAENTIYQPKALEQASKHLPKDKESNWLKSQPIPNAWPADHTSSCVSSVTTDLGLGTIYASNCREPNSSKLQNYPEHFRHFSGSQSAEFDVMSRNNSQAIAQSSYCSGPLGGQFDLSYYKSVRTLLSEKVGWQDGAISAISEAISYWKAGYVRRRDPNRGDFWFTFRGPDIIGKKRIASALAEVIFGNHERILCVDFNAHERTSSSNSMFEGLNGVCDYDVKFRGKTIVDYMASELRKKPQSLVVLQNVEKADLQAQSSLSQAIRRGKFADSHGREISINNRVFLVTLTSTVDKIRCPLGKESVDFLEEKILGAKRWQMQIEVQRSAEDINKNSKINIRVSGNISSQSSSPMNKRKLERNSGSEYLETNCESKRAHKAMRSNLDLNLPVEEAEENGSSCHSESDSISENSEAWLEDFLNQVDENIAFEPFDFDSLAKKILKCVHMEFQKVFGCESLLEIDNEVVVQTLAASWLSDRNEIIEEWVEKVLGRGFMEARQKYGVRDQCMVKLICCEGILVEDQAPGLLLPSRINMGS
ncbi:hypothetical protein K2173_012255 [Erythroxylum novogranatense]|uniref:Clp R domain-containing protein n=1 Tax=Erythroxylum novogranatense TaxID=1862640 RepID=A0AAV8SCD2_9ROSI|nr:hypothetical protein K2173_012255 [Erythroxylum novogranatense]